jgi:hypothetical protein
VPKQAALDPALFSAHGLRSGYLTEAANRGIPLPEAMQQSPHKTRFPLMIGRRIRRGWRIGVKSAAAVFGW